ncbi:transglycosylase SLT domain-containing protein, partial [Streptomyces sp. NPDC046805]|uniref:transglycosylase SLT domain-containing protein n=1 Tax=Streptomyces sp. NPDC046805 TaxID=3155134 RepID=UPI0033DC03F3
MPSKGLLQVINPTFNAYHVSGTSWNIYDPVANITAACNYAAARYGTIDNVNGAY